jgi:glycerol-3-phosphate acyltransferase PlsY
VIALGFIGLVILGYLIGSIPFGVIVGRVARGIDVRDYGSGSMGMTNVLRTVGARAGVLVFLADLAKGAAAVSLAWSLLNSNPEMVIWGHMAGGAAAVIGHSWPVFIGFRGGRGITTGFGALLTMCWPVGLITFAAFLTVIGLSRYVSLGSMLAALAMLVTMIIFVVFDLLGAEFAYIVFSLIVVPVIIFRHRGNIRRLLSGVEPKIGASRANR